MGFGMAPKGYGIRSKPQPLLQKTCLRMYALACVCKLRLMYEGRRPLWSFNFLKIDFFSHLKGYILHFNTPRVILISDWDLNWPWALEFKHHWGTGA